MKIFCALLLMSLMSCSNTPSLPSYKDSGQPLRPVNPDQLTPAQIQAVEQAAKHSTNRHGVKH